MLSLWEEQLTSNGKSSIEEIYALYPRKVGKRAALLSIEKALRRVAHETWIADGREAEFIKDRVREFASSPAGNRGLLTPHATTWFNQSRYLDDPKEWNHLSKEEYADFMRQREANVGVWRPQ